MSQSFPTLRLEEAWKNWINWDGPFKSESDPRFFEETDPIGFEVSVNGFVDDMRYDLL